MPSGERRVQETALRFYLPYINNRTDLFPTFRLKIHYQCALDEDTGSATKAFIEGYFKEPNKALILGILFSQQSQVVADVCRLYHVPIVGISFETVIAASNITIVYKGLFTSTLRDIIERMKVDDVRIFVAFRYSSIEAEPMEC
uniref:ANF_receptor domain-containing protein n=1 Tax=Macrostomum lignano TaxID=282301 RepID=A0A1I8IHG3_9PLAT